MSGLSHHTAGWQLAAEPELIQDQPGDRGQVNRPADWVKVAPPVPPGNSRKTIINTHRHQSPDRQYFSLCPLTLSPLLLIVMNTTTHLRSQTFLREQLQTLSQPFPLIEGFIEKMQNIFLVRSKLKIEVTIQSNPIQSTVRFN